MCPGYRDKGFPVRGLDPPGQLGRVLGWMPDRDAHFDRAVAVGGDHAVEDHEMPARYAAAPRSMSGEPGGSFPGPGQLTDVNVPLLGKHYLLRHVPFVDGQLRGGHLRRGYAWPEGGQDLPLGDEPPFRQSPVRVDDFRGFGLRRGHHPANLWQRHVQQAQHDDQARGVELTLVISAVAVPLVNSYGPQQPQALVQPQSLQRQLGPAENSPIVISAAGPPT